MKYVVGHQNPDTDSYAAAIVTAWYLNEINEDQWHAGAVFLGDPNGETRFLLEKVWLTPTKPIQELPEWSHLVLVDHNEASQSIPNREKYVIDMVIDHHKVADFSTSAALSMRLEPVACTCTILAEMMLENVVVPPVGIAELMIGAIISDTLFWRSPTTTQRDRNAVARLNEITRIDDLEMYSIDMFDAKSDLSWLTPEQIIRYDYKTFDLHGNTMWIWVFETTNSQKLFDIKEDLIDAIHDVKEKDWIKQLLFCVVDIIQKKNIAFAVSESEVEIVQWAFAASVEDGIADLWERVSRKKTIVPPIDEWFSNN